MTETIALLVGVLGFATAIITNARHIRELYEALTAAQSSMVPGTWTGIYREYCEKSQTEVIATETVKLILRGRTLSGTISTSENKIRDWKVSGDVFPDDAAMTISYVTENPKRQSIGTYVLVYDDTHRSFLGYWMGFDPELKRIVAFPYILTKEDAREAKPKHKAFLDSSCLLTLTNPNDA
jgi:hypothetical protein